MAAGAVALSPLAGCGSKSASKQTGGSTSADPPVTAAGTAASKASTNATTKSGATSSAASSAGPPVGAGTPLAATAKATIAFSFAVNTAAQGAAAAPPGGAPPGGGGPGGRAGGPVRNPFIAVWIEDASGHLLKTVSLWYLNRESKYLQDLTRWYTATSTSSTAGSKAVIDTVSGPTRAAGAYSVAWDGTDASGARVAQGQYFVCIEAAREHGPYELVRQAVTFGTKAFKTDLTANGELATAAVDFAV